MVVILLFVGNDYLVEYQLFHNLKTLDAELKKLNRIIEVEFVFILVIDLSLINLVCFCL
jgi:hypothetical protein